MAILGKIREKSIVLILVIGMALFAFVISGVFDGAGVMSEEPVPIIGDEKFGFSLKKQITQNSKNKKN